MGQRARAFAQAIMSFDGREARIPSDSLPSGTRNVGALVALWHFAIAAASLAGLLLATKQPAEAYEDRWLRRVLAGLVIPLAALYGATGVGILRRWNWSRICALLLNWINVLSAAVLFRDLGGNPAGVLSALGSCLVLWWLTRGAT